MEFEAYIEDDQDILSDADLQAMQKNISSQNDEDDPDTHPPALANGSIKESSIKESKHRSTQSYSDDQFDDTDNKRDSVDSHIMDQIKHMDDITSFEDKISSKRSVQIPVIPEEDTQDRLTTERTRIQVRDDGKQEEEEMSNSNKKKEEITERVGDEKENDSGIDAIDDNYSEERFDSQVEADGKDAAKSSKEQNESGTDSLFQRDDSSSEAKELADGNISANTFERASSRDQLMMTNNLEKYIRVEK